MPIYEKYLSGTTRAAYEQYLQDKDALDLTEELGILKGTLAAELESPSEKGHLSKVKDTINEIRKLSSTVAKNMEHARGYLPISFVPLMIQQIVEILNREVKDPDAVRRIQAALGRIAIPANSREARRAEKLLESAGAAISDT